MLEALRCVEEGVAPETVDAALVAFGMPMGPVELVDTVGLDIAVAAGKALAGEGAEPPARLLKLVAEGKLGRKSGEGYYRWVDGRAVKGAGKAAAKGGLLGGLLCRLWGTPASEAPPPIPAGLAERVLVPLLAATRRCVEQGVVADADLADAGVIFGTGFAPHTGGPLNYCESKGQPG
jgi:3-hydroxyacyl-CoA dehydrogenase/enoyl-CoA hydratase/3-hydroxybutyryl-CoA epimerase